MTGYYFIFALMFFGWVSSMWAPSGWYNTAIKTYATVMTLWSLLEAAHHFGYVVKI
jgi:hypothetical protein